MGFIESQLDDFIRKTSGGKYGIKDMPLLMDRLATNEALIQESHSRLEEMEDTLETVSKELTKVNIKLTSILKEVRK